MPRGRPKKKIAVRVPEIKFTAADIVLRKVEELVPFPNNPKIHTDAQTTAIAENIKSHGFDQPLLIDEHDTILKGHGRALAARKIDLVEVPVIVRKGLTPAQKWAVVISDNALPAMTGFDNKLLRIGLTTLAKLDYPLHLTGFDNVRLATFGVGAEFVPEPEDITPPAPSRPVTRSGDVWILGDHKLICGDCRNAKTVASLIGSAKINLAFTSPPYAEQRDYDKSSGFKPVPPDEYVEWFAPVASLVAKHLAADGSWFVNIKPSAEGLDTSLYVMDLVIAHARKWGWHFATEFCWERSGVPGAVVRRFKNQFEPVYQFVRSDWKIRASAVARESDNVPGGIGAFNARPPGERSGSPNDEHRQGKTDWNSRKRKNGTAGATANKQGSNWQPGEYIGPGMAYPGNRLPTFTSSQDALGHAAAFPVGLPEFFCKAYTDSGDRVYDPFMGSGSTLLAAHKTGRIGYGCEISPAYCDIIVKRWMNLTSEKVFLSATKKTFDQVEKERAKLAA